MAWAPLSQRIASDSAVPFVLAGPQPRLVTNNEVSVWVATRQACTLTLSVYDYGTPDQPVLVSTASASTRRLGARMHVGIARLELAQPLQSGHLYGYDLSFETSDGTVIALMSETALDPSRSIRQHLLGLQIGAPEEGLKDLLTYGGLDRPTFTTPAADASKLRVIHASCRKPHGEDFDATLALHNILLEAYEPLSTRLSPHNSTIVANTRPQHLFLGGDQIYADDVADSLMHEIMTAIPWLLDGADSEQLQTDPPTPPANWPASTRARLSFTHAGLTAGVPHPELASSHLFSFAEFAAMYLYAWSPSLWPVHDLPDPTAGFENDASVTNESDSDAAEQLLDDAMELRDDLLDDDEEDAELSIATGFSEWDDVKTRSALVLPDLEKFRNGLPLARRAMANIATLMVFDDHELTDDVFINRMWCERVFSKPLGRQVVRNGLAAYAMFQDIGNRPERYLNPVARQHELVAAIETWRDEVTRGSTIVDSEESNLRRLLGVPTNGSVDPDTLQLQRAPLHVDWSFHQDFGFYEVIALDGRTRRGYPRSADFDNPSSVAFAEQISQFDFIRQIPADRSANVSITFVMAPIPVFGWPYLEGSIQFAGAWSFGQDAKTLRMSRDTEAWGLQPMVIERLLASLAQRGTHSRVILLSGDVHFGFTQRIRYKASKPFEGVSGDHEMLVVQCVSSALKNETTKRTTGIVRTEHTHKSDYEVESAVIGWNSWRDLRAAFHDDEHPLSAHAMPAAGFEVVIDLAALNMFDYDEPAPTPDWRWVADEVIASEFGSLPALPPPPSGDDVAAHRAAAERLKEVRRRAGGRHFVGRNNLGDVTFRVVNGQLTTAIHTLWWRQARPKGSNRSEREVLPSALTEVRNNPYEPRSVFEASLVFDDSMPLPQVPSPRMFR